MNRACKKLFTWSGCNPRSASIWPRLRDEADIHIAAGYVDTAATPNETEPVITDQTEAKAKKLTKKKKKLGIL